MNEIECSYDCPVRSQCVHSTVKSESSWHPKYIGPDGCIHFKQIQPHFEKGRWVNHSIKRQPTNSIEIH